MSGLLDRFTKRVGNIVKGEVDDFSNKLENKLENAVTGLFSKGLKSLGISGGIARELTAAFGDSFAKGRADKYFGPSTGEVNRVSQKDICDNVHPAYAETAFSATTRAKAPNKGADVYQFPMQEMEYYMSMAFKQYTRTTPSSRPTTPTKHTIILPLPKDLTEGFNVNLTQESTGMAGAAFNALQDQTKTAAAVETMILSKLASVLSEATSGVSGQALGAISNPYVTLMFQGVNLRSFSFTWTFAPRNVEESTRIRDIVTLLKASALPSYSPGNGTGFLQYPLMCQIELYPWAGEFSSKSDLAKDNSWKNKLIGFKPAMIENVTVNYAPNGIPSFFAGSKAPTFIQLTLDFKEVEYFVAEDFDRAGDADQIQKIRKDLNKVAEKYAPGAKKEIENLFNDLGKREQK